MIRLRDIYCQSSPVSLSFWIVVTLHALEHYAVKSSCVQASSLGNILKPLHCKLVCLYYPNYYAFEVSNLSARGLPFEILRGYFKIAWYILLAAHP